MELYRAFLSYSRADERFARQLHAAIERFKLPRGVEVAGLEGRRLGRIYRDNEDLAAVPDLGEALRRALDNSANLVVVCSPEAAASPWVNREITYFQGLGRGERIFPVVVDGEADAHDPARECLPRALRELPTASRSSSVLPTERHWLDARKEPLSRLVVRLVAGFLDLGFDLLWQRDRRRRHKQHLWIAFGALVLAVAALGLTLLQERQRSLQVSAVLTSAARNATADAFSNALEDDRGSNLERAMRLGLLAAQESWWARAAPEAFPSLMRAAWASPVLAAGEGHEGPIQSLSLSADGTRLVSADLDGLVWMWDLQSARRIESLDLDEEPAFVEIVDLDEAVLVITREGTMSLWNPPLGSVETLDEGDEVSDVAVSADRRLLAVGHIDGSVRLWNPTERRLIAVLAAHAGPVTSIAIAADSSRVATGGVDGAARVWDAATGLAIATIQVHDDWVNAVALSPTGTRLLTAAGPRIEIWGVPGRAAAVQRSATLSGATDDIRQALFSPDGTHVAAIAFDRSVRLWNEVGGAPVLVVRADEDFSFLAFLARGERLLTAGEDGTARLWRVEDGRELARFEGHRTAISTMDLSADERFLVTSDRGGSWRLWDLSTARPRLTFTSHRGRVRAVAVSPGGEWAASAGGDGVRSWEPATGTEIASLPVAPGESTSVAFLADGRLMTAGYSGVIELWKPPEKIPEIRIPVQPFAWFHAGVSPDGSMAAAPAAEPAEGPEYNGTTLVVYDLTTGAEIARFETHYQRVTSVAFSPDGAMLATASLDGTACLWSAVSGEKRRCLEGHEGAVTSAAFSPDGRWIVTGGLDGTSRIWDVGTGRQRGPPLTGHQGAVLAAEFSPDQTRIATAGQDKTARIWHSTTGIEVARMTGHRALVADATFAAGGEELLTASHDGTVRLWDIAWTSPRFGSSTAFDSDREEYFRHLCDPRTGKLRGALAELTIGDIESVPLLAGRVGEDLCARWRPTGGRQ